jgi:hypothetical protein
LKISFILRGSFFYPEKTKNKMMRTISKRISTTEGLASSIDFLFILSILKMNKIPVISKKVHVIRQNREGTIL